MKSQIGLALGIGIGRAVYEAIRFGSSNIDWIGTGVVAAFTLLVLLLVPTRWLAKA